MEYLSPQRYNTEEAYDTALDHLVDTTGCSYDQARRQLGKPPYEILESEVYQKRTPSRSLGIGVARATRRSGNHGPRYGEEEGVGYINGEPHYYQPLTPLNDAQRRTNAAGIEAARKALAEASKTK